MQNCPQLGLKRIHRKKTERKTGELETVTWKPFNCTPDLDGEEKVHSQRERELNGVIILPNVSLHIEFIFPKGN